jgi:hypothetical protein
MMLVEINWKPTVRQLRQFGLTCLVALPTLGWLWGGSGPVIGWLAAVGLGLALAGLIWPRSVRPLFLALMIVTIPIGTVVGELAMLLIYLAVFFPMAIIFRLMKRDALQRSFDRQAASYWQPKECPRPPASYYRQS